MKRAKQYHPLARLAVVLPALLILALALPVQAAADSVRPTGMVYYLSDLTWESATHGDTMAAQEGVEVQRDRPFSTGRAGQDTKISLLSENGQTVTYEKGLGTIAGSPSAIVYDIDGKQVTYFQAVVGIDRSAGTGAGFAQVDKIEIRAEMQSGTERVLFTRSSFTRDTAGVPVSVAVPAGAKRLKLISYAGEKTWGDEVVFADAVVYAGQTMLPEDNWAYLSDIDWESATHGDTMAAQEGVTVQRDRPFSTGRAGQDTKISLLSENGQTVTYEKGLGTIAGSPSAIVYDISSANIQAFYTVVGIDRSANVADERHAVVQKISVLVDGVSVFEVGPVTYDTPGVPIRLTAQDIPAGAKTLELRSWAGDVTWSDEVVFADAKIRVAPGGSVKVTETPDSGTNIPTFPTDQVWTQPGDKRRIVDNRHPMMMISLYADERGFDKNDPSTFKFWGGDTLEGRWATVPDDLKPYTVIQLHTDNLPHDPGVAKAFYEHFLRKAQAHTDSAGQPTPIPIVLMVYTAGNAQRYTATYDIDVNWIDSMYQTYSCLQGIFSTESYWSWPGDIENRAAEYLKVSAKNGGYFIWSEHNESGSIEKALGRDGKTAFKTALEQYADNFIFLFKNTPNATCNDATTTSYMQGLWLTGYAAQWGGLMDTWKWSESGRWKLFEGSSIGRHTHADRQWLMEPEALLGIETLTIYLNGGCVYNYENPPYTYGLNDQQSPAYRYVIQELFRYAVQNPAPSKEEILAKTKVFLHGNYSANGNGNYFTGLYTYQPNSPTYSTGRYGLIPAVPAVISDAAIRAAAPSAEILWLRDERIDTLEKRKAYFNSVYPSQYTGDTGNAGDLFAQKLKDTWFAYNFHFNEDTNNTGSGLALTGLNRSGISAGWTLKSHSFAILKPGRDGDRIHVKVNNYRVDKTELWDGSNIIDQSKSMDQNQMLWIIMKGGVLDADRAINGLSKWSKTDAHRWLRESYIPYPKDSARRETVLTLSGLTAAPSIANLTGKPGGYDTPVVCYDADTKTATILINSNGYVYFDVVL